MENISDLKKNAEKSEKSGDFLSASSFYSLALEEAKKNSDGKEIKKLKNKLKETSKKAQENFGKIEFEIEIPTEIINKAVDLLCSFESLEKCLRAVGVFPDFELKEKETRAIARKTMPTIYNFTSFSAIDKEGHHISGGGNGTTAWFFKIYTISQDVAIQLQVKRIFEKLKKEKGLNAETLYLYLKEREIFSDQDLVFLKVGLKSYFDGDYISALHILVPKLEKIFLELSEKCGVDIVALNRTTDISTQNKTLSLEKLRSEEFQKVWGENLCFQLAFSFFEPLGFMLRHKIAHGTIQIEECNERNTLLVIYFFLVFSARVNKLMEDSKDMMGPLIEESDIDRFIFFVWGKTLDDGNAHAELEEELRRIIIKKLIGLLKKRVNQ